MYNTVFNQNCIHSKLKNIACFQYVYIKPMNLIESESGFFESQIGENHRNLVFDKEFFGFDSYRFFLSRAGWDV